MQTYKVKFSRDFEVDIHAETLPLAGQLAKQVIAQFPAGSCKILSIIPEGYVEPPDAANDATLEERRNAGLAVKVRRLTDQPEPDRVA